MTLTFLKSQLVTPSQVVRESDGDGRIHKENTELPHLHAPLPLVLPLLV